MNAITKELLDALKMATLQNQLDMLMTGEELRKCESAIAKAEAALAALQSSDDVWIPWAGGDCPVAGEVIVAVKDKNGDIDNYGKARLYDWYHTGNRLDIIAYRVVKS